MSDTSQRLPGRLYFAVDPQALRDAVAGALAASDPADATLAVDERLAAAHLGVYKQDQVGDRWSPLVPPDTWETMDEYGFAPGLVMPVERLLRLLAGRLRFLGAVSTSVVGALVVPLGFDRDEAGAAFGGRILSRTLVPPAAPDHVSNFPPELSLLDSSQALTCRRIVDLATQRYVALDNDTFRIVARNLRAETLEEADRLAMAYLATLNTVTRELEAGNDVLLTNVL